MINGLEAIDSSGLNDNERLRLLDALRAATRKVQTPWDIGWEDAWVDGCTKASIKSLIDIGVFTKWAESGSKPSTTARFAELTGADPALLGEILLLLSMHDPPGPSPP